MQNLIESDLDYYRKQYLKSEKNDFLICSSCEERKKQNDCFTLLENTLVPPNKDFIYHTKYIGGFPNICGPLREISDSEMAVLIA